MSRIDFIQVEKAYKSGLFKKPVSAVAGLNLTIFSGEVFGLVGPNGAGKSSTIRMLLNLSRPDRGEIKVNGALVSNNCAFLRHVGYLPENPYLYDHLSLAELLCFSGAANDMPKKMIEDRILSLTKKIGIIHALHKPLRTFSKGMRQRAGLCFALLHDPSLIILDEPMSGLDPLGRRMVCELILALKAQGKTIFFCSHILSDVERLCDRIAIMDRGRLVRCFADGEMEAFRRGEADLEEAFVSAVAGSCEQ